MLSQEDQIAESVTFYSWTDISSNFRIQCQNYDGLILTHHPSQPHDLTWVDELMESAGLEETGFLIEVLAADAGMNERMNK